MKYKTTQIAPFGVLVEPSDSSVEIHQIDVEELRALVRKDQLIVCRGFRTFTEAADFSEYCEHWGRISVWSFGKVLELLARENPEDHIFDNSYIPLHWDGMYRPQIPEYQIFHCVRAPLAGQGGRTTFSNTILALKNADAGTRNVWNKVTGLYKRKMEFYESKTTSPIVTKHPYRDFSVLRYNELPSQEKGQFINPPDLTFTGLNKKELENFHQSLKGALYDLRNFYAHEWQTGDVVIADNFSLLHGREKFSAMANRHLQRVHVLSDPPFDNPGLEFYK